MLVANMMRYGADNALGKGAEGAQLWANHPMMWGYSSGGAIWVWSIFCIVSWVAVIAVLIALARWLWKKGDSETKRR